MSKFVEAVRNFFNDKWGYGIDCMAIAKGKAQIVLPSGERVILFNGRKDEANRYVEYLRLCNLWLKNGQVGAVPTFQRHPDTKVTCPMSFTKRVDMAAALLREQDTDHRAFDATGEFGDGYQTVLALMNIAKTDAFLAAGIEALGEESLNKWRTIVAQGGGLPLLQMSMACSCAGEEVQQ